MRRAGIGETCIGIFILLLLAGVAGGMYFVQSRYDPDYFRVALQKEAGRRNPLPSPPVSAKPPAFMPEDLVPLGSEESFDPETLSDKIDGKAELYLSSGFVGMTSRRFAKKEDPKSWLELSIYDMGNASNAFSVYSLQKRQDTLPVELGVSAYATEDALFFANGARYYEIVSSSKDLEQEMLVLAKNLVEAEPKIAQEQNESSLFPAESLDKSSISLHMSDVFGFSGLDRVYTARYGSDDAQVTAFISKRANPKEAAELANSYGRFLIENGGSEEGAAPDTPDCKIYKVFDTYEVVLHRGSFFAGAHEAENLETATGVGLRIYKNLDGNGK